MDDAGLEDSLMQPADPTQSETAAQSAETEGDQADTPKPAGALAALVKVETDKCAPLIVDPLFRFKLLDLLLRIIVQNLIFTTLSTFIQISFPRNLGLCFCLFFPLP